MPRQRPASSNHNINGRYRSIAVYRANTLITAICETLPLEYAASAARGSAAQLKLLASSDAAERRAAPNPTVLRMRRSREQIRRGRTVKTRL